jgi:hypothetical protein
MKLKYSSDLTKHDFMDSNRIKTPKEFSMEFIFQGIRICKVQQESFPKFRLLSYMAKMAKIYSTLR